MTWETTLQGKQWTHGVAIADFGRKQKTMDQARGGRTQDVKKGVYIIDHKPTGRFIVGSSDDVSKEVDNHIEQLVRGSHGTKHLQRQYGGESYLIITEIPTGSDKDIKRTIKEIRETNTADYCLLDEVKHNGYLQSSKQKASPAMAKR